MIRLIDVNYAQGHYYITSKEEPEKRLVQGYLCPHRFRFVFSFSARDGGGILEPSELKVGSVITPVTIAESNKLSASEAVLVFSEWLKGLDSDMVIRAKYDSEYRIKMVLDFIKGRGLVDLRPNFQNLVEPLEPMELTEKQ